MFDADKTRDFLEASEQRMEFFSNKEKYLYDKCIERYLGAARLHYGALYVSELMSKDAM